MNRRIFRKNFLVKVLPVWAILSIDVLVILVSSLLAYALRYDFRSIFLDSSSIDKTILWVVIVNLIFFLMFRTYSNVLRFSSFVDIMRIFVSLTVSYVLLMSASVLIGNSFGSYLASPSYCSCPMSSVSP